MTATSPSPQRPAVDGTSATPIAGPTRATRMIRLHARPECVSSANRSFWNASLIFIQPLALSRLLFAVHLFPQPHVGNALVVACDHNLRAFFEGGAVFATGAASAPGSGLRVNDFSSAVLTDGHRDSSQHADHLVVGGVHVFLVRDQHAREEQKDDGSAE